MSVETSSNLKPYQGSQKPFTIYLNPVQQGKSPYFIPTAHITINAALRTSGFWHSLNERDLKLLILLLTFLSSNGDCVPSKIEIADSLRISYQSSKELLKNLSTIHWKDEPILIEILRESGLDAFTLAPHLFDVINLKVSTLQPELIQHQIKLSERDAVIAHSRSTYARPRADVEKEIAKQLGYDELPTKGGEEVVSEKTHLAVLSSESELHTKLLRHLIAIGISKDKASQVLEQYTADKVQRQLFWLPYRHAKNPAAYLLAALEGDYDEPKELRQRRELLEQNLNMSNPNK